MTNKQIKRKIRVRRPFYLIIAVIILAIGLLIGGVCKTYYDELLDTIHEESSGYLQEVSTQISKNVRKTVSDNFAMLKTVNMLLGDTHLTSINEVQPLLEEQKEVWNYQKLMLIDTDGNMYDTDGKSVVLDDGQYLRDVIVNRKESVSSAQNVAGEDCILFTIPVDLKLSGKQIGAIGATYRLDTFDQVLSTSAFDGQAYTHIINKNGTVAVPSSSKNAAPIGYNLFSYLDSKSADQKDDFTEMRSTINEDKSGYIVCTIGGINQYITFHPIETQGWYLITFVPASVVNAKSDLLLNITVWFCVFLSAVVIVLMLTVAITSLRHRKKLEKIAFIDPVTGGGTLQQFYLAAQETFRSAHADPYALIFTNMEKFRLVNEQYGRESGDGMLRAIQMAIESNLQMDECIGHTMADHFCILVKYEGEESLVARFQEWHEAISKQLIKNGIDLACPTFQFGVYVISVTTMPISLMVDRAKFSLRDAKTVLNNRMRYAIYNEQAHQRAFREKTLEDRMEKALAENEFVVFLQPKYHTSDERIGGAEALVRWRSPEEGMIYPDEFIPLFENNGFIYQLDLYVFEQVCKSIRRWIDAGQTPMLVSVNCSRIHFDRADFLAPYRRIFERYDIPPKYIEIELTESIVYENMRRLSGIIDQIHDIGFRCSIDDFGSGYSSLNMIRDIPADTLKLDKIFFRASHNEQRTQSVVKSIVDMAKALSMSTVAEGVEERAQVEMLREMECDYIQGYVYAKPMPIASFEELAFGAALSE